MRELEEKKLTPSQYEVYATVNRFTVLMILVATILFGALAVIFWTQERNYQAGLTGQTYARIQVCILSVPPSTRSAADVERCYKAAQADTGVTVDRYQSGE